VVRTLAPASINAMRAQASVPWLLCTIRFSIVCVFLKAGSACGLWQVIFVADMDGIDDAGSQAQGKAASQKKLYHRLALLQTGSKVGDECAKDKICRT
jgi:hypothetical protein